MAEGAIGYAGMGLPSDVAAAAGANTGSLGGLGSGPDGSVTFRDILHGLNPLQHLPVIGMIYRAITGDQLSEPWRLGGSMISGMITGGPIGMIASAFGSLVGGLAEQLVKHLVHDVREAWNTPSASTTAAAASATAAPPGSPADAASPAVALAGNGSASTSGASAAPARVSPSPSQLPPSAQPVTMPRAPQVVAREPGSERVTTLAGLVTDFETTGQPTTIQRSQGIAAYARVQGGPLAATAQAAQDVRYAAYGSG
jgi:hypothetical protein